MKTWVAENVLCDWTCGLVTICAKSEKEAIRIFYKQDPTSWWVLYGDPTCRCHHNSKLDWAEVLWKYHRPDRLPHVFKLIKKPSSFSVSGGG